MRTHHDRLFVGVLLAVYFSPVAVCQDQRAESIGRKNPPLQEYVEEFFLSDAVRNQGRGQWQFAFGVDSRKEIGTGSSLRAEYGITNRLQIDFELPYGMTEEETSEECARWSITRWGLQYQIRRDSLLALTVGMEFGVPLKAGGETEYSPTILLATTFRRLQVHAGFIADIEEWKPSFQYNLATVYPVGRRWFPTLEFNGRRLRGKGAFYMTPGLYRRVQHRLEFGLGAPLSVGGAGAAVGIVGKMSWELGGEHESE